MARAVTLTGRDLEVVRNALRLVLGEEVRLSRHDRERLAGIVRCAARCDTSEPKLHSERAARAKVGTRQGAWTFQAYEGSKRYAGKLNHYLRAACDCGEVRVVRADSRSLSCGCKPQVARKVLRPAHQVIRDYRENNRPYYLYELARKRVDVREGKVPFAIRPADIVIPARCPILNIEFAMEGDAVPVLVTDEGAAGYVPGNILVISERAQKLRQGGFIRFIEYVRRRSRKTGRGSDADWDRLTEIAISV